MPEKIGYITEPTAWHKYQSQSHAGWWYLCLPIVNLCMSGGNKFDTEHVPTFSG